MRLPDNVRESIYEKVHTYAESQGWMTLSAPGKSLLYSTWSKDPEIGGILIDYMGMNEVHRYIKDTVIKAYAKEKISGASAALNLLGVGDSAIARTYEKPPGVILMDHRVISWHDAKNWKTTILAVYERARQTRSASPYGVVLFESEGKFADATFREIVSDAAERLGIERLIWHPA